MSGTTVLTAFDLQGAVLLIQRVAAQVHHAGCSCGDPTHTHTYKSGMENIGFMKKSHEQPGSFHLTFTTEYAVANDDKSV